MDTAVNGYVVIDFETTGFSPTKGDRVVELGLVRLDAEGNIVDSWETLINPERHIGATNIHGIRARDVFSAPTFNMIADMFATELQGSVFVGHNAGFDASFAVAELTRAGRLDGTPIPFLDTVALSRRYLSLPAYKLENVSSALGITNRHAHSALSDALTTAEILQYFIQEARAHEESEWQSVISLSTAFDGYRILEDVQGRDGLWPRSNVNMTWEALGRNEWINQTIGRRDVPDNAIADQYFRLLDSTLLDRQLSQSEQMELLRFARTHDLSVNALHLLHENYLYLLKKAAEADGIVTKDEAEQLEQVRALLGIRIPIEEIAGYDPILIPLDTDHAPSMPRIHLNPGDRVTITGPILSPLEYWIEYFESRDITVAGIAKATRVLIAGDTDSQSSKAKKARSYGIPIISEQSVPSAITFTS